MSLPGSTSCGSNHGVPDRLVCSLRYTQMVPKRQLAGRLTRTDFFNTRVRRDVQKCYFFCREQIWVDSTCFKMGGKLRLKLWVRLGSSPWSLSSHEESSQSRTLLPQRRVDGFSGVVCMATV